MTKTIDIILEQYGFTPDQTTVDYAVDYVGSGVFKGMNMEVTYSRIRADYKLTVRMPSFVNAIYSEAIQKFSDMLKANVTLEDAFGVDIHLDEKDKLLGLMTIFNIGAAVLDQLNFYGKDIICCEADIETGPDDSLLVEYFELKHIPESTIADRLSKYLCHLEKTVQWAPQLMGDYLQIALDGPVRKYLALVNEIKSTTMI